MNNELYHFGILGMKWGRRRYQYENGRLTPEGKEHYKEDYSAKRMINGRSTSEISTDELSEIARRMQAEKNFNDMLMADAERQAKKSKAALNTMLSTMEAIGKISGTASTIVKNGKSICDTLGLNDNNSKKYAYNKASLDKALMNPDKYSDEWWKNAKARSEAINSVKKKSSGDE